MNILVTGATGYIGRYIVSELVKIPGHTIVVSGRNTQKLKNIADNYNVQKVKFNLYEEQYNWFEMVGEPDMLIHLAWGGLDNYDSLCHIEQELCAHYSFLKNMIENGFPHLSVTGTCLEYGKQEGCMCEHTPTAPVTSYGVAKDTLHRFLRLLQKNGGFFVLKPEVFKYLDNDDIDSIMWEESPLEDLTRDGESVAYQHEGFWKCMDALRDREELENLWSTGQAKWNTW
jgi:nucleoside-diphosphate-sugar epimerase